jgi:hypothetical protein
VAAVVVVPSEMEICPPDRPDHHALNPTPSLSQDGSLPDERSARQVAVG